MPSKSRKQERMMAAAAHDPAFAKKVGVPVTVAKEFNRADAARAKKPVHHNGATLQHPKINHSSAHAARGSVTTKTGRRPR